MNKTTPVFLKVVVQHFMMLFVLKQSSEVIRETHFNYMCMLKGAGSYPSADAASTGGDLEVSIQIFNGSAGEESLHHQQDAVDEKSRSDAIDHIFDYINPAEGI